MDYLVTRLDTQPSFSHSERHALSSNGWQVAATTAIFRYRGGLVANVKHDGRWTLYLNGYGKIVSGRDDTAVLAAMEVNERAWARPEYKAARSAA